MPRVSRQTRTTAAPPTMQQSPPTPDSVMHTCRGVVAELVALGRDVDDIIWMVQQQPTLREVPVAAIRRMRAAAQAAFEQGTAETLKVKRAKQERRIQNLIGRARSKGSLAAEVQAERLLAELNGTLAPREIVITADAATRDALAAVLSILPADVLLQVGRGESVPLGHVGPNGQPVMTIEQAADEA